MRTFSCQRPSRSLQSKGLQQCIRNSRTLISEEEAGTVRGSKGGVRRPGCVQHSSKPPENALIIISWLKVTLMLGGPGFLLLSWQQSTYRVRMGVLPCWRTAFTRIHFPNRASPKWDLEKSRFPQDLPICSEIRWKDLGWQGDSGGVALKNC